MLHVIFTPDGIPGHISLDPRPGSQPVEPLAVWGDPIAFLAAHRRTDKGQWVPRDPVPEWVPSPEDLAAQSEAEYQAAVEARIAAIDAAIEASEPYRQYKWGEITLTAYRAEVAKIVASFPVPERG